MGVISIFMLSLASPTQYYQLFLSQGIGMGIGAGLLYTPAMAVQAPYWRAHRARAIGIVATGTSVGGLIFPIMLNHLLNHPKVGFAWGVRASGFLVLGCLVVGVGLMRPVPKPQAPPGAAQPTQPSMRSFLTDGPYMMLNLGSVIGSFGMFFPCE